jgi:hypothetical protein
MGRRPKTGQHKRILSRGQHKLHDSWGWARLLEGDLSLRREFYFVAWGGEYQKERGACSVLPCYYLPIQYTLLHVPNCIFSPYL